MPNELNGGTHQFLLRIPFMTWLKLLKHCERREITKFILTCIEKGLEKKESAKP